MSWVVCSVALQGDLHQSTKSGSSFNNTLNFPSHGADERGRVPGSPWFALLCSCKNHELTFWGENMAVQANYLLTVSVP